MEWMNYSNSIPMQNEKDLGIRRQAVQIKE
jgi:hypothetical protein